MADEEAELGDEIGASILQKERGLYFVVVVVVMKSGSETSRSGFEIAIKEGRICRR
jgi:hypothetical protein